MQSQTKYRKKKKFLRKETIAKCQMRGKENERQNNDREGDRRKRVGW